jgi:hypothetical protein
MTRQLVRDHAPALAIMLASFVLQLCVSYGVFRGFPFCMDEYGYWYQAELFARGSTHLTAPDDALSPLKELYVVWHDGKVFSKYPPGFSLVLSLGSLIGAPAAVNPTIAAITTLLLYIATLRLVGRPYAIAAQLLLATSPFFVAYGASYFAHSLTLLLVLVVSVVLTWPTPPTPRRWLAIGGVLGAFVWVRPLDALCAALFVMIVVVRMLGWRRAFVAGLQAIGPFIALVLALMAYNDHLSGRFALSTYPVLDAEFRLVAAEDLGFFENAGAIADEYVRRLVLQGEVLWGRYFLWPAGVVVPILALGAIVFRAGERRWRIALAAHFVIVVLLYNFHGMQSSIPTWPQYGARYWFSGFGAILLLAAMSMQGIVRRVRDHERIPANWRTPRTGHVLVGLVVGIQIAAGIPLFHEYARRFDVVFAIQRDIAATCPGKRVVVLDLPQRPLLPDFVRAADLRRNPFLDGDRLFVGREPSAAMMRALPGYTTCRYAFARWDAAR